MRASLRCVSAKICSRWDPESYFRCLDEPVKMFLPNIILKTIRHTRVICPVFRPPAQVVAWLPVCASVCQCVDRTPNWFSQIHSHHQVSPYLLIHYHLQSAYKYKVWICVLPQMKLNPKFICIWLIGLHSTGPPNAQTCFLATFEPQIWRQICQRQRHLSVLWQIEWSSLGPRSLI